MIPKTMPQAAMEAAEQAWQAHEGAARQKSLAALLMTFVSEKVREAAEHSGLKRQLDAQTATRVAQKAFTQFQKHHLWEIDLRDTTQYQIEVVMLFDVHRRPIGYDFKLSDGLLALQEGKAAVSVHHFSSPYYATGHGNWERHHERAWRQASSMVDYFPRSFSNAEPPTTSFAPSPG